MTYNVCFSQLTPLKKELVALKELDSIAIQASLKNLSDPYSRFFKKQNQAPRFESKKNNVQSYTTKHTNGNIATVDNKVKLPKLGFVTFAKSREVYGRIINATVRRNSNGKYFVAILAKVEIQPLEKADSTIGIDLGMTEFAILSDGHKIDNNTFTSKMEKKLKREQRKLSKRTLIAKNKGIHLLDAKNYQKQKLKIARLHERVIIQQDDFLNELRTEIIKNHDIICTEGSNTKGMLRNHKLEYKAIWYGKKIVNISRWFPSSQICSNCGHHDGKKSLEIRD